MKLKTPFSPFSLWKMRDLPLDTRPSTLVFLLKEGVSENRPLNKRKGEKIVCSI